MYKRQVANFALARRWRAVALGATSRPSHLSHSALPLLHRLQLDASRAMSKRAADDDDIKPRARRVKYDPATQKEAALFIHLHAHAIGNAFDEKKKANVIVKHGTHDKEYGARPCRVAPVGALQLWKTDGFEQYGGFEKLRVKVLTLSLIHI